MRRKLPLTGDKPTVELIRKRLGGRASSDSELGEIVSLTQGLGIERLGVVLFVQGDEVDVWTDTGIAIAGVVRRTRRALTTVPCGPVPETLAAVARDARVFGSLPEGGRVRYQLDGGRIEEATLVEKCRYGALVLRDDGVIVGVGFRRVWPAAPSGPHN